MTRSNNPALVLIACASIAVLALACASDPARADPVRVRYVEGLSRGFLILRTMDGTPIAEGESSQSMSDGKVTSRLNFRFKDGSLYDDETSYTEHGTFRLLSDHLTEKGPSFKTPTETWIDTTSGSVTVRYSEREKEQTIVKKMELPPDLANGLLYTIVKNIRSIPIMSVSYLATTPKPEVVKLVFTEGGKDGFRAGPSKQTATRYVMKVDIGGVKGVLAEILKKRPPETIFWVLDGAVPVYAGSEGPLYADGPIWRIDPDVPTRLEEQK